MTTATKKELENNLRHFTGTEQYWHHKCLGAIKMLLTDGTNYLREQGHRWLMDEVAIAQSNHKIKSNPIMQEMQFWTLKRVEDEQYAAILTCDDGNGKVFYTKEIPYTDTPLNEIKLYVSKTYLGETIYPLIYLPSEY